ncbi:MAG: hypothetical protein ABL925_14540 [Methylococcales bacterium]
MKKIAKKSLSMIGGLTLMSLFTAPVFAAVVSPNAVQFSQGSIINTANGDSLTVDLIGSNFSSGPDGVAFSLAWDPSVLSYVQTSIANPPWDTSTVNASSAASGLVDFVFLGKSVGDAGANFALGSFTFNVVGGTGAQTTLSISNDPFNVGFVSPGAVPISVNYLNSQVQVVPVPAAVWLFGTAIAGFAGMTQRRLVRL